MKATRLIGTAATAVLFGFIGGCADGGAVLEPVAGAVLVPAAAAAESAAQAGNPRILASGEFVPEPDFANATLTPQGNHCIVQVDGVLIFFGTLDGVASGTSTARVFATCAELALPGSLNDFRSVFRSEGVFTGTVDGAPAEANFVYQGRSDVGGQVDARVHFSGGLQGVLHVDAEVAEGGSYEGFVIRRGGE
jgi:hypothetical protein